MRNAERFVKISQILIVLSLVNIIQVSPDAINRELKKLNPYIRALPV